MLWGCIFAAGTFIRPLIFILWSFKAFYRDFNEIIISAMSIWACYITECCITGESCSVIFMYVTVQYIMQ